jgi:hypothetical protein
MRYSNRSFIGREVVLVLTILHAFPDTERVVGIIEFDKRVLVATEKAVYEVVDGRLIPLEIEWREE